MVDGKWKRAADYWRFTIFHLPFAIQEMRFSAVLLEPALENVRDDGDLETGWSSPRISRMPRITPQSRPYGRPPGGGRRPPSWQAKIHKHKQHPCSCRLCLRIFACPTARSAAERPGVAVLNRVEPWSV
jgi:hypothetical protein